MYAYSRLHNHKLISQVTKREKSLKREASLIVYKIFTLNDI